LRVFSTRISRRDDEATPAKVGDEQRHHHLFIDCKDPLDVDWRYRVDAPSGGQSTWTSRYGRSWVDSWVMPQEKSIFKINSIT
jgi:hypothetical protein